MLNYRQFLHAVKNQTGLMLGEDVEVTVKKVRKNNVGLVDIMAIKNRGESPDTCPAFSMQSLFLRYSEKEWTLEEIMADIKERYFHAVKQIRQDRNSFQFLNSYEDVREKIFFRAVSRERNRELLDGVPHVDVLDFSVVFAILAIEKEQTVGTVLIRNEMLEQWGVSLEDIREQAGRNTGKLFPVKVCSMSEIMCELTGQEETEGLEMLPGNADDMDMYIVTNRQKNYGFSTVLYENVLKELAQQFGKNLYILPSSIHEAIVIPEDGKKMGTQLRNMVREVNQTQVPPEEVMSDEVYYYDREKDVLEMAE